MENTYTTEVLRLGKLIAQLQSMKAPRNKGPANELITITGYDNIVDILLYPLYYRWERLVPLEKSGFEKQYTRSYMLFCLKASELIPQITKIAIGAEKIVTNTSSRALLEKLIEFYV